LRAIAARDDITALDKGLSLSATNPVEIWEKVDERTVEVDVWVYDPPALVEPWYVKQRYSKVSDQDRQLRIRYWDCLENPNNAVYKTQEGSTQFKDFTFTKPDGK